MGAVMRISRRAPLSLFLSTSVLLSACASGQEGFGQALGALAAGGLCLALIDKRNQGACVAAAAAGFVIGGAIGRNLDERDRKRREQALAATLNNDNLWAQRRGEGPLSKDVVANIPAPTSEPTQDVVTPAKATWTNPDTQNAGAIEPLRAYKNASNNRECRQFRETYWKKGEPMVETRTECKDAEGHWV